MRLRTTKTLRVFPNPWGVHPSLVIEKDPKTGDTVLVQEPRLPDDPCLDPEGRPCHVVPSLEGSRRMVGARFCEKHTKLRDVTKANQAHTVGNIWKPPQRTVYAFLGVTAYETEPHQLAAELAKVKEPVELPKTEQCKQRLLEGALIAADKETADEVGLPFLPVADLFPLLSKQAAAAFDKHNYEGDPAYAHFCAERGIELADPKPAPAKVEPMVSKPQAPAAMKGNS